ncbi:hypothetical protein ACFVAD_19495 [Sutcliffiella sp. NPDC057660]|uniref:hypothetical protein n=1 Tax=Sutcliffiella sp. NPDC057660 TaxID=3346199 RepID=UPI0036B04AC3
MGKGHDEKGLKGARILKKIIFFILLLLTAACSKETNIENQIDSLELVSSSTVTYNVNGQEFQIIPYYQGYLDFIHNQKTN